MGFVAQVSEGPDPRTALNLRGGGQGYLFECDDLDRCYDRVLHAGWPIDDEIAYRPWGSRNFRLLDPSGYYLRLTEH